jgi:hypothetical protein
VWVTSRILAVLAVLAVLLALLVPPAIAGTGRWVTRDARANPRGPWRGAVAREMPQLYRQFNGIDYGHAHLAETLLDAPGSFAVESARIDVLSFIAGKPPVPPEESLVAPGFTRMVWGLQRTFDVTHTFHRSLYDLFASDRVADKRAVYRKLLADYLSSPDAITPRLLDHHGKLWSFPESKAFRDSFPKFNAQIWTYHWLQAAVYDVQLLGPVARQRQSLPVILDQYHEYLNDPPVAWKYMPLMAEVAPRFTAEYPEAAAIFDNLHMLHDNVDDILTRRDLFPTRSKLRDAILTVRRIYLNRSYQRGVAAYAEYEGPPGERYPGAQSGHTTEMHGENVMHGSGGIQGLGPRPPSAGAVLRAKKGQ